MVFGLGAHKSGSTWLFDVLHPSRDVHARCLVPGMPETVVKEAHYFDRHTKLGAHVVSLIQAEISGGAARLADMEPGPEKTQVVELMRIGLDLLSIYASPPGDHDAYLRWLCTGYAGQKVIADFTPSYAMLGAEVFAEMAAAWPRTRFIFIMRDPVDRLWSHARYDQRNKQMGDGDFDAAARAIFGRMVRRGVNDEAHRSNYVDTLTALDKAVPSEDVLYLFYEDLFRPETVQQVADFLGIHVDQPDFGRKSNEGREADLPEDMQVAAAQMLAPQYEYVSARFGDAVPPRWRDRMALAGLDHPIERLA